MKHTELDLIVAELMFPILVEIAPTGETITYKEIAELIKARNPNIPQIANITQRHIGRKLGTIWEFTKTQGCPHIGSLVVIQGKDCGEGINSIVKDLPKEREKVKKFDWSNVSLGFEAYISEAKIYQKERDVKPIKRSRDEAKESFYKYWKDIQSEAPISSDKAIEMKERILELIQNGLSPEEAFSQELLKFLDGKKRERPDSGYVYLGEYIDSETNVPLFNQVKIGYTANLARRADDLSGGVDGPLKFEIKYYWEFTIDVAYAIEQALHGRFTSYRKKGEFFINEGKVMAKLVDDHITQVFGEKLIASNFE
jgi:hypothetical protein